MSDFSTSLGQTQAPDLLKSNHVHLVGIKGVAMTSLAQCLDDVGINVTGSDVAEEFVTQKLLETRGFTLFEGFSPDHITSEIDTVVYTGAHQGRNNIEVQEAHKLGIPAITHAEALGLLMKDKKGISVCGTGGKSTTSAMIAWILEYAKKNPSYSVGVGNIPNLEKTGMYSHESEFFVAEADEYAVDPTSDHRPRFIFQEPMAVVCPNLSYDHPDIYPDFNALKNTFISFFKTGGSVYINGDNQELKEIFEHLREHDEIDYESCSVGFSRGTDYKLEILENREGKISFAIEYVGYSERQPFLENTRRWVGSLQVPGKHNVLNAALAFLVAVNECGVEPKTALQALSEFKSTMRRFEYKGNLHGMPCYDDYAHTPDEIRATLTALKEWYPTKKIIAAFQPHTYSRTKALFDGFVDSLLLADGVILLDIFASAREAVDPAVNSQMLANKIQRQSSSTMLHVAKDINELLLHLPEIADTEHVFITLGAGDIYKVYEKIKMKAPKNTLNTLTFQELFPSLEFKRDIPLAPFTYMKVGGPAKVFVEVKTKTELADLCSYCFKNNIPFVIIGGASNVIIPDEGIDKLVIRNLTSDITFKDTGLEKIHVHCDSGVVTAILSHKTIEQSLTGLEHFVGVPGTIGGAIVNNSHFTAHELIGNFITSVEVCTEQGKIEEWSKEDLKFGYDYSVFHTTKAVILSATFALFKGDLVHIKDHLKEAAIKRTQSQPIGIPSSGCMYKNPTLTQERLQALEMKLEIPPGAIKNISEDRFNVAAGFLIDQAGLKKTAVGGASVSEKHATFLVNDGTATSRDIETLCQKIEAVVFDTFGVRLEREVFFLS